MSFKVGDLVQTKAGSQHKNLGYPPDLTQCEVVRPTSAWGVVEVNILGKSGPPMVMWESDLEYIPNGLPKGQGNLTMSEADMLRSWNALLDEGEISPVAKKCDCGGYKTYKSFERSCHSHWCSSQQ